MRLLMRQSSPVHVWNTLGWLAFSCRGNIFDVGGARDFFVKFALKVL
jgi:hypothetical protein